MNKNGQVSGGQFFISFILGTLLIILGIIAWSSDLSDYLGSSTGINVSSAAFPWIIMIVGLLIVFIPINRPVANGIASHGPFMGFIRRWVFGIATILIGLVNAFPIITETPKIGFLLENFLMGTWHPAIVLILFGLVYLTVLVPGARHTEISSI